MEVFDIATQTYYQSLQAANTGNSPSVGGVENSAWWAACKTQYAAPDWLPNTPYNCVNGAADQVRNPADNQFYQCIASHTSGATWDATKWGLLRPFNKYIAYEQTGLTAIGEIFRAWDKDPRVTTQRRTFPFWLSEDGVQFSVLAPAVVWIFFRIRRPVLTGDAWDSTAAYASGAQVYYAAVSGGTGNFYTANQATAAGESPASAADKWDKVEIPYFLQGYLKEGGYADWLTADGQGDKAQQLEPLASSYLELEADKVQRQEQQVARFSMG
jgi:hypothetical protein